ncbi:MAG: DNA internalization-related competence protein ComEC/Rec2 [Legionellaceae bacterium]|nr:DNA internalization-related competence protein ComEC/Rec2 [Legionellaceae bacterium]
MEILCFFSGVAFFYLKNGYALALLMVAIFFRPRFLLCAVFCLGFMWAWIHMLYVSPKGMPKYPVISSAMLTGSIISVPVVTPEKTQFELNVLSLNGKKVSGRALLSCYEDCPLVSVGELWQLEAKLKQPQNLGNPGGFNLVRALRARHIEWVGYTRRHTLKYLGEVKGVRTWLLRMRMYFSSHLKAVGFSPQTAAILNALTLGLGSGIQQEMWGLFRRTGTTHLMVISGAHIGLVAGLTYGGIKSVWSRLGRLPLKVPAARVASMGGILMALIYSVLAGFGVPAQRALIVCFFMLLRHITRMSFSIWQAYRYALLTVLLFEPHAVLMPGFYLSFIAVGILICVNQLVVYKGVKKVLCMQLACLVGLMPLTLFLFAYGSINGFFANLIAIPWVGFVLIPAGLITVFLGPHISFNVLYQALNKASDVLLQYLTWVDGFENININVSLNTMWCTISLMCALGLLLFFPIKRFLPVILVFITSGLYAKHEKVVWGEAVVDVLDVGQGLAVVIQTAHHKLIYDTGIQFYHGGDMGQLALIPYLKTLKTQLLDMVVISHPDIDHRGGLASLEKAYAIKDFVVDDPTFYHRGVSCHQYAPWRWDGVQFQFLPLSLDGGKKNNHSCILKVTTDFGSMLLTGDIEQLAERYLMTHYPKELESSYLLVPHHESNTSSSTAFLEQVAPKAAIVSLGFDNRYHFPHPKAARRYTLQSIPVYSTEKCGLVRVMLKKSAYIKQPLCTKHNKKDW